MTTWILIWYMGAIGPNRLANFQEFNSEDTCKNAKQLIESTIYSGYVNPDRNLLACVKK